MTAQEKYDVLTRLVARTSSATPPHTLGRKREGVSLDELLGLLRGGRVATRLAASRSVYVHVPFCARRRCSFCMYRSTSDYSPPLISQYCGRLGEMVETLLPIKEQLRNLYIGGGTPTVLLPEELSGILGLFRSLEFNPLGERTCEMSPTTASVEHVDAVVRGGVNRISIGVQSFDPEVLGAVNRAAATPEMVSRLIARARSQGVVDANVDLMFGLPKTNVHNTVESVKAAISAGALSVSAYNYRQGMESLEKSEAAQEMMARQFHAARDEFERQGWTCVSGNDETEYHLFYSPDRRRDTLRYWTSSNGIENYRVDGFGSYACGFTPALSYTCVSDAKEFSAGRMRYSVWQSDEDEQMRLGAMNILYANRNTVDEGEFFSVFGVEFAEYFKEEISELRSIGKCAECEGKFSLLTDSHAESAVLQRFFLPERLFNGGDCG